MASLAGFDSFGSFMRGMGAGQAQQDRARQFQREEEDRAYQQGEREYQQQRRGVIDQRQDTTWDQSQADRVEDRDWQRYMRGAQREDRDYTLQRRPIEAQQKDAAHDLNMQSTRQAMGIRGAQAQRSAQADSIKLQMAELGLDEAQLVRQHREFAAKIGGPARRFAMTGDTRELSAVWREAVGGDGELVQKQDGTYVIASPTQGEQPIGSRDDVITALSTFSQSPEAYLTLQHQLATGIGQRGQRAPAAVETLEYYARRMPQRQGESDEDYFARVSGAANQAKSRPEQERFEALMQRIMSTQEVPDPQAAAVQAREIMNTPFRDRMPATSGQRGQSQDNPVDAQSLSSRPPPGTWVRLPSGAVMQVPN